MTLQCGGRQIPGLLSEDIMALRTIATAATILCITLPAAAHSQRTARTACNDGTTTTAMDANACDGHGGIHRVHTAIARRAPGGTTAQTQEPGHVAQAGTPANSSHAQPAERRGWRWARHDDRRDEDRRRAEEQRRAEEKRRLEEQRRHDHDRVRCRDGRFEEAKVHHGNGRGPDVCRHHGGIAH